VNSKPIVVLKGGRTNYGMKAASSHTGSIASNYIMLKNSLKQAGVFLCENANDFVVALKSLSFLPIPKGEKIGVLTNSGGCSVLFSDKAEEFNLKLAEFSHELKEKVSHHLITNLVKLVNPLDMIGAADENTYYNVTKLMLEDSKIDIVVACVVIPPFLEMKSDEHYRGIIRAWNETGRKKPLIPLLMFSEEFKSLRELSVRERTTVFFTPHEASFAIKVLIDRMNLMNHLNHREM
jgi:acetyltransferase